MAEESKEKSLFSKAGDWIASAAGMVGAKFNKKKRKKEDGGDPEAVYLPRAMGDMVKRKKQLDAFSQD